MQQDYVTIKEREMPMSMTGQTFIFEVAEESRAGRATPSFADTLAKVVRWLSHLGSGNINDGLLEARHNVHHDFRVNGIGR